MDAIAVVLALEDYQNSIPKNLRVRDVTVDIYGVAMVFPTRPGERFFFIFLKAKQYKLINEDLVSGGSRI